MNWSFVSKFKSETFYLSFSTRFYKDTFFPKTEIPIVPESQICFFYWWIFEFNLIHIFLINIGLSFPIEFAIRKGFLMPLDLKIVNWVTCLGISIMEKHQKCFWYRLISIFKSFSFLRYFWLDFFFKMSI